MTNPNTDRNENAQKVLSHPAISITQERNCDNWDTIVSFNGHVVTAESRVNDGYAAAIDVAAQFLDDLEEGNVPSHYHQPAEKNGNE